MYAVIGRRHGKVLSADLTQGSGTFLVRAVIPVIESFNFAQEIRKQTSGLAYPQLMFSHWEVCILFFFQYYYFSIFSPFFCLLSFSHCLITNNKTHFYIKLILSLRNEFIFILLARSATDVLLLIRFLLNHFSIHNFQNGDRFQFSMHAYSWASARSLRSPALSHICIRPEPIGVYFSFSSTDIYLI